MPEKFIKIYDCVSTERMFHLNIVSKAEERNVCILRCIEILGAYETISLWI